MTDESGSRRSLYAAGRGSRTARPLVGFNLGVEVGQVTVLALAFVATFWFITHSRFRIMSRIASAMIALVGLYWTYERVFL